MRAVDPQCVPARDGHDFTSRYHAPARARALVVLSPSPSTEPGTIDDSTDRLVAELKITPLGTAQFSLDVHTYKTKTSQSFWTRENGMPTESLTLPGRSWRFEAKAPGYRDLVRTLRVSDENTEPLMVLTIIPSGG